MTEGQLDFYSRTFGGGLAYMFNRLDFLMIVQLLCLKLGGGDKILAEAQMIPTGKIPVDPDKYVSEGPLYRFAKAYVNYFWQVYYVGEGIPTLEEVREQNKELADYLEYRVSVDKDKEG